MQPLPRPSVSPLLSISSIFRPPPADQGHLLDDGERAGQPGSGGGRLANECKGDTLVCGSGCMARLPPRAHE